MKRDLEITIRIPKEREEDIRVFTVVIGGSIVSVNKLPQDNKEEDENAVSSI